MAYNGPPPRRIAASPPPVPLPAAGVTVNSKPLVAQWSLHTLKGKVVLKMTAYGGGYYAKGSAVNELDFWWEDDDKLGQLGFRGTMTDTAISLLPIDEQRNDSRLIQTIEIAVTKSAFIDQGNYKPKAGNVGRSPTSGAVSPPARPAPIAPLAPPPAPSGKVRKMDLTHDD